MQNAVLGKRRQLAAYAVVLCVAGLGVAAQLFFSHVSGSKPLFCEAGAHVSCDKVLQSPYARVLNTPVSLLGVGYFVIALGMALFLAGPRRDDEDVAVAFFLYVVIGVASCVWFIYAEWLIGALCPLCTIVHVVCFALLPLAWILYRLVAPSFSFGPVSLVRLVVSMHMWALLALLVVGTPIVWVNVMAVPQPLYADAQLEELGKCLRAAGVTLYTRDGCVFCTRQKQTMGAALKHIPVVECEGADCMKTPAQGFPSFVKKSKSGHSKDVVSVGLQSIADLARFGGCPMPTRLDSLDSQ